MTCARAASSLLAVLAVSFTASGQSVISTHSGLVYFFEGSVMLGDQPLEQKFGKFPDIGQGRELRTEQGRAEVLLTPGAFLRVAENSRIRMLSTSLSDTRAELLSGSAVVEATEPSTDNSAQVIYKSWRVTVPKRGIYRIDSEPPQLRVFKGEAEVRTEGSKDAVTVKDGQVLPLAAVLVTDQAPAELNDAFDHWAMTRSQAIYADNATAAQIIDDPNTIDSSGLAMGGLSYFPMTGVPSLGLISPYGLSFWSPFQPTLNALYLPGYGMGWAYPGGLRLFQLYPLNPRQGLYPTTLFPSRPLGNGGLVRPGGIPTSRVPAVSPSMHVPSHGVVGARGGGHR
jgi:FecR protein